MECFTDESYMEGIIKEFRQFYDKNGYLPHKTALRLIEIAELLIQASGKLIEGERAKRDMGRDDQ